MAEDPNGEWRLGARWLAAVGAAALLIGVAAFFGARPYFERLAMAETQARATLFQASLEQTLTRFEHLPRILRRDPSILGALYGVNVAGANTRLARVADAADVEAVYLMNADGLTIAASNHAQAQSFLGQNYAFRPYFRAAMAGRRDTFFAVGATTGRPGFFLAEGVENANGQIVGAIAVKIGLSRLTNAWAEARATVFVSNADGVVILSSEPALTYHRLEDIPFHRLDEIAEERQFAGAPLDRLDWANLGGGRAHLRGVARQHVATRIGDRGWTLHLLGPLDQVYERTWLVVVTAVVVIALLAGGALFLRTARMRQALVSSQEARRALVAANAELRQMQEALERRSRLAALGRLSASVTHELGQPISALRNYLTAEEMTAPANPLLGPVGRILERMEGITRQLRFFARPSETPLAPVDLRDVAAGAAQMVAHDAARVGVEIAQPHQEETAATIAGDALRLEQVAVNILRNAIAATEEAGGRRIVLAVRANADEATLSVRDQGPGLAGRTLEELSEPFRSTRKSGEGMGLGLAISADIIQDHGGRLAAEDAPDGGAVFSIILPRQGGAHGP